MKKDLGGETMAGKKKRSEKEYILTPQQAKFVQEYMIDGNATQAAIRAGYSTKSAEVQGHRLLRMDKIQAELAAEYEKQAKRLNISKDWALIRLKKISDRCIQEEPVMAFDRETKEWVHTGEYKFDSAGAIRATELIGKHFGMFVDKVEHTGKLEYEIVLPEELDEG